MALRFRRGTDSQRQELDFIPETGEPIWTTDTKKLYIGDGTTAGGILVTGAGGGGGDITGITDNTTGSVLTLEDAVITIADNVDFDAGNGDILLGGGDITGTGNIDLLGGVTASGTVEGNIGNFGSANITAGLTVGGTINSTFFVGDHLGSVFADDSTLVIDGLTGEISTSSITTDNISHTTNLSIVSTTADTISAVNLDNTGESQYLKFRRTDSGTAPDQNIGLIGFDQIDDTGTNTYVSLAAWHSGLYLGTSSTGSYAATNYVGFADGNMAIGDYTPTAGYRLDVRGNAIVSGSLEAGAMLLSGSNIDTSDSSAITVTPGVTFSSDVTVENNLTVTNTLTVDTLQVTNFETVGGGTPELESDTDILLTAGTRVEVTSSPLKMASFSTTERNLLTPENGDIIYNTTDNKFQGYENGAWANLI